MVTRNDTLERESVKKDILELIENIEEVLDDNFINVETDVEFSEVYDLLQQIKSIIGN
jgi:hypothetical protein